VKSAAVVWNETLGASARSPTDSGASPLPGPTCAHPRKRDIGFRPLDGAGAGVYGRSMAATRVVLGEDSLIVREGVRRLLELDGNVEVVAVAGDMGALRDACESGRVDVLLTDIRMPPTNTDEGIRLAAELRDSHPEVGVVVLSQYDDPGYVLALLDRGSDGRGYLLKQRVHNRAELTAAIQMVADGGSMIDPKIAEALVRARTEAERSPLNELTAREREVLAEIAQGKSNTAIAESLFLTKRAVEKHINAIFLKLGLADAHDVSKRVKAALVLLAETGRVTRVPAAR
jgi:DNA-binding NarL/FixJ family response regulator